MKFKKLLKELSACNDAIVWAGKMTIEEIVEKCHRGDWLLWLAARVNIDRRKLFLAKGHCANTVRHLMKDERSVAAVDAAIAYGSCKISDKELETYAAAAAAYAADAADYADAAADVAAYAAGADAAAYDAAYAAADVAAYDAAAYAAADVADAAGAAAKQANQLETANICRKYIGQEIIDTVNEMLNRQSAGERG